MSGKSFILADLSCVVKVTKKKGDKNSRLVRGADGRTLRPMTNTELNTGWVTHAVDHGKADSMAGWRHDD